MQRTSYEDSERRMRPSTYHSDRGARRAAPQPRNIHFSTRERRGARVLADGMTPREVAQTFGACLVAVLVGKGLLDVAAWCFGHFAKGWW